MSSFTTTPNFNREDEVLKVIQFLQGRKTYSVVIGAVLLALAPVVSGEASLFEAIKEMLPYLGLGGLRAAIK